MAAPATAPIPIPTELPLTEDCVPESLPMGDELVCSLVLPSEPDSPPLLEDEPLELLVSVPGVMAMVGLTKDIRVERVSFGLV